MAVLSQNTQIQKYIAKFMWIALDWLYPPRCCNCDSRGAVLCETCFENITVLNKKVCKKCGYPITKKRQLCENCSQKDVVFDEMRSWATYEGVLKKAIQSLKYKRNLALGPIFTMPLVNIVRQSGWLVDMVIPIPLSRARLRQRGYNQAAIISSNLALTLGLSHTTNVVKRRKETETQVSLDVNKRFTNLMDAFYANPAKLIKRKVLLIDDVITTGATMLNCAETIKNAGADKVYCLSVARSILHHPKSF